MVTISEEALQRLKEELAEEESPDAGVRIAFNEAESSPDVPSYELVFEDAPQPGDWVREIEGVRLFVDDAAARRLRDARLEVQQGELSLQLAGG